MPAVRFVLGHGRLEIRQGDITAAEVGAVVNAANSRLAGGGGVDGALQRTAGPQLLQAGQEYVREHGPLSVGDAVVTPGFALPAPQVIHTVGPIWRGGGNNEEALLERAYANCLQVAKDQGIQSIAFPAISCGVYGFPEKRAAAIAIPVIVGALECGDVSSVALYLYSSPSYAVWCNEAQRLIGAEYEE